MNKRSIIRWSGLLSFTLMILSIPACGYHLRGDWQINEAYLPILVSDNGEETHIKNRLIRELNASKIPQGTVKDAKLRIIVSKEKFDKNLVSKTTNIDTYEISYKIHYKIIVNNQEILTWQNLRLNRILQFSKSEVVSSATEEVTLRNDLTGDAASQIITRLRFLPDLIEDSRLNADQNSPKQSDSNS